MDGIEREVERQGKMGLWQTMHRIAPRLPVAARRRLFGSVHKRMGGSIRYIVSGGAYLDPSLAGKWERLGIPVVEGYGATEAAPVITFTSGDRKDSDSVGRVLSGQEVRIAEDGEVLTRGPNVTPGYWQNEGATAAAFEGEWYKTGDLGYLDSSGDLYLKGRKKDLIVLANGQNVYPEDIERLLNADPAVKEGVVVGLPDERSGGERVHAVLLAESSTVPIKEIVDAINDRLADHQRIASYDIWHEEDFPRTHTLKVKKGVVLDYLKATTSQGPERAFSESGVPASAPVDPVVRIIAQIAEVPVQDVEPATTLGDLSLDSLKRVEFLSIVEQEMGAYLDESSVGPSTTVAEIQELVGGQARATGHALRFYQWPLTPWCTALRQFIQNVVVFPWLGTMYRASVTGLDNLVDLEGPVIFAINHNAVQWDSLLVLRCLPKRWRRRIAYAAAAEVTFGNLWLGILASLVGGAFPFDRETAIRQSLEYLGSLLDGGWSVGIFPEGEQRVGQEMLPFKNGVGLLGVECQAPIVPVRLVNHGRPSGGLPFFPKRVAVSVRIGTPLMFAANTSYIEAAEGIEQAVRSL